MMESLRKWVQTLALLMLGMGVLMMGARGMLPAAQAQQGVPATCEVVQLGLTDTLTAEVYSRWANGQLQQGRSKFMALPGVFPVVCAW
jgi:hypothetical protein